MKPSPALRLILAAIVMAGQEANEDANRNYAGHNSDKAERALALVDALIKKVQQ